VRSWTATVEADPDDPDERLLNFQEDFMKEVGWNVADTLTWTENGDDTWTISKVSKS
jgi:hypothetical protein|tara:strand:+ start:1128 stop:1298 length:171 start_codon:yes stop_codon:yes gene_type:complete